MNINTKYNTCSHCYISDCSSNTILHEINRSEQKNQYTLVFSSIL